MTVSFLSQLMMCPLARFVIFFVHQLRFKRSIEKRNNTMNDSVLIPIRSVALITVATTILTAAVLSAVVISTVLFFRWLTGKSKAPLPPFSKGTMFENIAAIDVQKTLYQLDRDRGFFHDILPSDVGGSPFGAVFRAFVPTWDPIFFVSDYRLAKLILAGDSKEKIKECDKARIMENMNFTGLAHNHIITDRTGSMDREEARKTVAQAFSTTNLGKTWPTMKGAILQQFDAFRRIATTSEGVFEAREVFELLIMRTVTRGIYGVEFTDDGTESETTLNGLEVLKDFGSCSREAARRIMNPFRQYMFWEPEVIADREAHKRLHKVAEKLEAMQLDKQEKAKNLEAGVDRKPYTILDHIMLHNYKNVETRYADIIAFALAATDTTTSGLCLFMMEMSRQPQIRAKLQYELSHFMPENRSQESLLHNSSFNDRALLSAIAGCEYLNWCLKESMRLWPVAGGGPLRDVETEVEYNGIRLPKGSKVACQFYSMFRERWIDRPDEFIPERWADSNPQLTQLKEMLMPFSIGKRSCVGQNLAMFQLKIIIAHFMHYFDFELAAEPELAFFVVTRTEKLMLKVTPKV